MKSAGLFLIWLACSLAACSGDDPHRFGYQVIGNDNQRDLTGEFDISPGGNIVGIGYVEKQSVELTGWADETQISIGFNMEGNDVGYVLEGQKAGDRYEGTVYAVTIAGPLAVGRFDAGKYGTRITLFE